MLFHLDIKIINIIHILFQGILFLYIGIMKNKTNILAYWLLLILTLSILLLVPLPKNLKITYWNAIKVSHYIIFLPLLLYLSYLGIYRKNISKNTYDFMAVLGIFIILYHSYKLYDRLK
tara:strand:- start:218 stop:574 length:357 start_codon:yes stop_codon:yes gene_type:complete